MAYLTFDKFGFFTTSVPGEGIPKSRRAHKIKYLHLHSQNKMHRMVTFAPCCCMY